MGARFARIYPIHFVTLVWISIMLIVIRQQVSSIDPFLASTTFSYWGIPTSLLLIQSLHLFTLPPLNGPSWSLSTEWWIYLLFPFLIYGLRGLTSRGKLIVLLGIIGLYVVLMYYVAPYFSLLHKVTINLMTDWGFFRCLAGFALGMLFYEAYSQNWGQQLMGNSLFFMLVLGTALVALHIGANDLLTIAVFPFIILSAAYQRGWIKRLLTTRPLQRLGDWSFSIYMVHVPIIFTFYALWTRANPNLLAHFDANGPTHPDYTQGQVFAAMLIVLTLIVSATTYYFIEVPARNYVKARFNAQSKEPVAVAM